MLLSTNQSWTSFFCSLVFDQQKDYKIHMKLKQKSYSKIMGIDFRTPHFYTIYTPFFVFIHMNLLDCHLFKTLFHTFQRQYYRFIWIKIKKEVWMITWGVKTIFLKLLGLKTTVQRQNQQEPREHIFKTIIFSTVYTRLNYAVALHKKEYIPLLSLFLKLFVRRFLITYRW